MEETLYQIAKLFNMANITWAIGGSYLLKEKGITSMVGDLDIFVDKRDAEKAKMQLAKIGARKMPTPPLGNFRTETFEKYQIGMTQVDLIAGFAVLKEGFKVEYNIDKFALDSIYAKTEKVPALMLEDMYFIYLLIGDREDKVRMLEGKLKGRANRLQIDKLCRQMMPASVKMRMLGLNS